MAIDPGGEKFINKRAIRRYHRQRIISKRYERVVRGVWFVKSPEHFGKTNTVRSCWMCGNPRKYFGLVTRQEMRADEVQEGKTEKQPLSIANLSDALQYAEQDIKDRWQWYKERYIRGLRK